MRSEIENLLNEVRLLFNRAVQIGEELHANEPVTMAMRAVLEYLEVNGPASVPAIARSRHVTRQHIQTLVDGLLKNGLVVLDDNPAHNRSKLVRPTAQGKAVFRRIRRREEKLLAAAEVRLSRNALQQAAGTISALREALGHATAHTPKRKN
jgi:DNA-binding MarR family transcriptional regulator